MIDIRQLKELTKEECIIENEPLAGHTTFRIGGPADYFATFDGLDFHFNA